jgi:hypothetical protein
MLCSCCALYLPGRVASALTRSPYCIHTTANFTNIHGNSNFEKSYLSAILVTQRGCAEQREHVSGLFCITKLAKRAERRQTDRLTCRFFPTADAQATLSRDGIAGGGARPVFRQASSCWGRRNVTGSPGDARCQSLAPVDSLHVRRVSSALGAAVDDCHAALSTRITESRSR